MRNLISRPVCDTLHVLLTSTTLLTGRSRWRQPNSRTLSLFYISDSSILVNKKFLLLDRKRCTARGVANAKPGPVQALPGEGRWRLPLVLSWFCRRGQWSPRSSPEYPPPSKGLNWGTLLPKGLGPETREIPPLTDRHLWKHNLPSYSARGRQYHTVSATYEVVCCGS